MGEIAVPDLTDDALTDEVDSNEVTLCTPLLPPDPVGVGVFAPFPTDVAKATAAAPPTYPIDPMTLLVAESFRSRPLWVMGPVG